MKQFVTIFFLAICLLMVQQEAFAQPKHGLTFRALWYNYDNPEPAWEDWSDVFQSNGRGIELAYNRRLDNHTWLVVPVKIGTARRILSPSGLESKNELLANLDVQAQHYFFKYDALLNPFVHLGIGSSWNIDDDFFDFNIPAGVGLSLKFLDNVYVNVQTQFRFSLENRPGWHHGLGATFYFGGEEPPPPPADRDGDGILDVTDKCPDVPGVAELMGCPDRDGDGIADGDDQCPDEPGIATFFGCPDTDGDGIADKDDKCPKEAGPAATGGCPDRDGDGVVDREDRCPDQKGLATLQGCPDRDGDGIRDGDDDCPDQKGTVAMRGCPDQDGDGVADKDDRCPDKAGPASNKGCPEIKQEDKAKLERAIKLVQFQSGSATLLKSSYPVLDEVVSVMNQYPEYSLNISGHTDASGDDKMNQSLSERRAKTCYDYLVSKGIAAGRMAHAGYGETKPVADNKTAAGRAQNRRVEFELYVK
ncbi:MAG: OmpA family protein [Lewinellaceae bacterium]|jgi:OOP family OmpA-OmpF porin|nr:OmpA family protein [Lewinellaceae bacterium]